MTSKTFLDKPGLNVFYSVDHLWWKTRNFRFSKLSSSQYGWNFGMTDDQSKLKFELAALTGNDVWFTSHFKSQTKHGLRPDKSRINPCLFLLKINCDIRRVFFLFVMSNAYKNKTHIKLLNWFHIFLE
jgi:hypothetical protein